MKIIIDEFIERETELVEVTQQLYEDSVKVGLNTINPMHIEYHKSLVVILDVFKLLCCMVVDKLDYRNINEEEIKSLIEETRIREIEKGSDA